MASKQKPDEPRPAVEEQALEGVADEARRAPTARQAARTSHADNEFSREQILLNAQSLVGAPRYMVEVALVNFADDQEYYTVAQVQRALDKLNNHEIEVV